MIYTYRQLWDALREVALRARALRTLEVETAPESERLVPLARLDLDEALTRLGWIEGGN